MSRKRVQASRSGRARPEDANQGLPRDVLIDLLDGDGRSGGATFVPARSLPAQTLRSHLRVFSVPRAGPRGPRRRAEGVSFFSVVQFQRFKCRDRGVRRSVLFAKRVAGRAGSAPGRRGRYRSSNGPC